jgi:hypothetical protein
MEAKKNKGVKNAVLQDALFDQKRDEKFLLSEYKDQKEVLRRLCEISTGAQTYEFLGEMFFTITIHELKQDSNSDQWIRRMVNMQNEVYELYELARAAKALKMKEGAKRIR